MGSNVRFLGLGVAILLVCCHHCFFRTATDNAAFTIANPAVRMNHAVARRTTSSAIDRLNRVVAYSKAAATPESFDMTGKVVLVTGASRGIGAAIAEQLAKAGATVVGTATTEKGAEAIGNRFGGEDGLKGDGMALDVTDESAVEAAVKAIEKKHGGIDVLVNNAGITKDGLLMRMKSDQWDAVLNTNLKSVYTVSRAVLKGMMKRKSGRVVSISSVVGSMGNVGQTNYAAAKAGLEGFTRAAAKEYGAKGITINAVAPGFIATDMTEKLPEEWKAKLLEAVPANRLGAPKEIADAVHFLSAPASSYVTGHTLHVNGGMYV